MPFDPNGPRIQTNVDPRTLLPGEQTSLSAGRLNTQLELLGSKPPIPRYTPIRVTRPGVVYDGHHGVRAAIQLQNRPITVEIMEGINIPPGEVPISEMPIR